MNLSKAKKEEILQAELNYEHQCDMIWQDMIFELARSLDLKPETVERVLEEY